MFPLLHASKFRTKRSQFRFSFTIYIQRTQLIKNQVILYDKQYVIDTSLSEKLQSLCFMELLETDLEITITTWRRKSISAISTRHHPSSCPNLHCFILTLADISYSIFE